MTGKSLGFCIFLFVMICNTTFTICNTVIGIDLGTAYSSVGIYRNGEVIIIPNEHGNKATPSCVAFLPNGEVLIGEEAIKQSMKYPKTTIYNVKRLIGRQWNDALVQKDIKSFPFQVFERKNKPYIQITQDDQFEALSPEEITALILGKMKEIAEEYIGEEIIDAVITTPAYFNEDQRQATKDAGELAGLKIRRIFSEPTAAALSHGFFEIDKEKIILVYDLGGGTFDVSVVYCDNGVIRVLATVGNTDLGGEDFNMNAINFILQKIRERISIGDLHFSTYPYTIQKLREEVEFAKRKLTYEQTVEIEIENDFRMTFSRAQFEEVNKALYETTLNLVKKVLEYSELDKLDIDDIFLVGGSSKMPKVKTMLASFFNGKLPTEGKNLNNAVVRGAAIEAAIIAQEEGTSDIVLIDVYPFSVGWENSEKNMVTVIPRNHFVPVRKTTISSTAEDCQTNMAFRIFRGEYIKTEKNLYLGKLVLYKIPSLPKGVPIVEVSFEVNENGILNVTAMESTTGNYIAGVFNTIYHTLSVAETKDINVRLNIRKHKIKLRNDYKKVKNNFENMIFMINHCVDQVDKWVERNLNHNPDDFTDSKSKLYECVCIAKYGYFDESNKKDCTMKFSPKLEVMKIKYLLNYANKKMMSWLNINPEPSLELLTHYQAEMQEYTDVVLFSEVN